MATWQQGINSGGFLAGIGTQNENAPKASDINATLGLIRENNELARSGANNVGLTALRGLAGVADIYKQEQQQKAINAFNKVHADAWASGDPSGLFKFAQENPAFVAQAQQAFSGLNDQQRNDMGDLAMRANVALSQGPEAYSKFITDNKDRLNRVGANADWMIQTGIQNPEQLSHMLTTMSLGALGPEKAFAVQDKMVGRQQDQQKINETIRNNDMTNARGWASNNIAQQNVNLRRMELEDKKYDRLIANETNALKLAELQDKRLQNQQAMEQAKRDKADAYNSGMDNLSRTIETATKVLNSPGFTGYFGTNLNPLSSRFIPGTEAADTETLVDTLKSQGFLSGIQQMKGMGALSNAEGQKVMDAIGSLSPNQSEKSARAAIKTIIKTTEMAQKRMQQKYGKDIQPSQQQLSDDDLINKYLGGQ
ncbi:TPA: DNA transfer protein [Escherichia coli]|uniref:DNA transfer protein n=1 Tax=Escherichia coli TaxID=562 RepID=UPI001D8627B7|nr:DNA transfer protein [Escherichia coli]EEG4564375.1 acyltransferase [Salmonella enterica subsp. enterica serovar Kentucky]EFR8407197.1 acyltransferase [Escherichia coli]EHT2423924.1 DNA transfer protein [Salmonella enterica subsp. enterica serovar Kentucky]MCZ5454274.1 DNA transfer protein [Escherichia coli]MDA2836070.1 DNA transfer protein [Escherichia coli]